MRCKVIALMAALIASPCYGTEATPTERAIPVASFRSPPLLFTCIVEGLPSVGINYGETKRRLNYNNVEKGVIFHMDNSVNSIVERITPDGRNWTISSSGPALSETGPLGYEAKIELIVTQHADERLTADWTVLAGDFTSNEKGCAHMNPPKPIGRNTP